MISINATLILQVIHFLILTFILNRLMFRPLLKIIDERTEHIEKTKNEIKNIEQESERLKDEYRSREDRARKDTSRERIQIRSSGVAKAEEHENNSRKEVISIRAMADAEADREVENTRPSLQSEANGLANAIVRRIIGRRIVG